jgi:phage FluMu protein gp41
MAIAVSDSAAQAIALAIGQQTAQLEKLFGPLSVQQIGTVSHTINSINQQDELLVKNVGALSTQLQTLNTNLTLLAKQVDTITTGLGVISVNMSRQLATAQLVAANQIEHAAFQQKTVNQALEKAGEPPVVVTPENFIDSTKSSVQNIATINAQTSAAAVVNNIITSAVTESFTTVSTWAAGTSVGKFVTDYLTVAKLQAQAIFADEKTAKELRDRAAEIIARRAG